MLDYGVLATLGIWLRADLPGTALLFTKQDHHPAHMFSALSMVGSSSKNLELILRPRDLCSSKSRGQMC